MGGTRGAEEGGAGQRPAPHPQIGQYGTATLRKEARFFFGFQ